MGMSTFDPAAHLSKQGWKGKGTALKQGHATRPLAVVQKKNLSGIGKDRDEAVPFWDQIFAATAASIFSPSPSGSGSSTPLSTNAAHSSTRSWTTTTFGQSIPLPKPGTGVSTAARVSKEQARRGLYSRFMRGKVVVPEPESESERSEGEDKAEQSEGKDKTEGSEGKGETKEVDKIKEGVAGPSTPMTEEAVPSKKSKGKAKEVRGEETKEEKRIRKAEKAKRREEKEARRATKSQVEGGITNIDGEDGGKLSRKRKDLDLGEDGVGKVKKVKKEKKEKILPNGDGGEEGKEEKVKKEKRKKEKKTGEKS